MLRGCPRRRPSRQGAGAAHGAAGAQVYFWSSPWIVPASFPLGETVARVVFKTVDGKTATFDYALNIIP